MNDIVKKDLTEVLNKTKEAINKRQFHELRDISDHSIHTASVFQDEDSISLAVAVYALFKIMYRTSGNKTLNRMLIEAIDQCVELLELNDFVGYHNCMKDLIHLISKTDHKMRMYIEHVINHAEIKKGSKLYENGISLARAAEVLDISQWELMRYVGKMNIPELESEKFDVMNRMNFARKIFNITK